MRLDQKAMNWAHENRFAVLNDFAAVGYGVSVVPPEDLLVLNDAPVVPEVRLRNITGASSDAG